MATWGALGKQYEMTMAHPCLHEKPHWMCFHIRNGLNYAVMPYHDKTDKTPRKFISAPQDSILVASAFRTIPGICRDTDASLLDWYWISCLGELKREPLSNPVPVCVQQLISVYSMWWIIEQHLCHSLYGFEQRHSVLSHSEHALLMLWTYPSLVQISLKTKAKYITVYLKLSVPLSKNNTHFYIMCL